MFAGLRLKSDSTHAPFAQPSPPPRRNLNHRSASDQPQKPWRPSEHHRQNSSSVLQLISPPIVRKPPPQPQWVQEQQLKKRKLRQPKQEEPVLPTTITSRKVRSRIPFQWRTPVSASGDHPANPISLSIQPPPQHLPQAEATAHKLAQKKSLLLRNFINSNNSTCGHPSSSAPKIPQDAPQRLNRSDSSHTRSCSTPSASTTTPLGSYDSFDTQTRPTRSSSRSLSSSSSSIHPSSTNHLTDSEFESLSDDHEEVLSSHSHFSSAETPPASLGRSFSSSSRHSLVSVSQSMHSEASCRSIGYPRPPPEIPLPPLPSDSTPPSSSRELPFACPSPNMPHRATKRHARPTPAQAPPLPRSRTPSLVIRPKFTSSTHNLDLTAENTPSKCNMNLHTCNSASDQDRLTSRPKSDMMRGLGWGRAPIDPPRLISPSPSLSHNFSSSDLSINRPLQDSIISDYLLASHSSSKQPQSSSPQVTPLHSRTKKFKDRFTFGSTAPLRFSKKQHARHQSSTSGTGLRIVSGLFGALSPTTARHTIMDLEDEKRKLEFKRMISYPVLNHSSSGDDDEPFHDEDKNYESEPEPYDVSIEAAMRSLEGIKPNNQVAPIRTPGPSTTSSPNMQQDRPISWILEDKPDLTDIEIAQECSFTSEKSDAWQQKLRRRVSVNLLMMKSRGRQAHSPSPVGRSRRNDTDSGSLQNKAVQKQPRKKASARLKPLIRKVSSVSLRQRGRLGERENGMIFETHHLGKTGEESEEEELLSLGRTPVRRTNAERAIKLRSESRLRQIHSSISRGHTPRGASSPTVSMNTPQRRKPLLRSSQSIREKRKIFEQPPNPSVDASPPRRRSVLSSSVHSMASSSHSMSKGTISTSSEVDRRSSVPSETERRHSKRKPTPAEIKLRDETQSVKALVDKFETQHHHTSLGRSIESDSHKKRTRDSWKADRTSGTGVVRTSLLSLWSGDRSSLGSRRVASRRISKQLILDQRRKTSGRSSHSNKASEGGSEAEGRQVRKLKKKTKKIFRNDNSSSSSFGCAFNEADEYTYDLGDPHVDLSLPVKLSGSSPDSISKHHLSMPVPKSSIQQKRSTWSVGNSSPRVLTNDEPPIDLKLQSFKSRFTCSDFSKSHQISFEDENHAGAGSEPQQLSEKASFDCTDSGHDRPCSPLSSDQAHKAQTVLEPQTVWMGDGSQRQILVAGGCLQVAKKIPFPSFEDDAEFSQPVNIPPATIEPPPPQPATMPAEQPTQTPNRVSTFLMTRKFDDVLDDDKDEEISPCRRTAQTSLKQTQESGMLSAVGIAGLEDSPTLGRSRRSWNQSRLLACSTSSQSSSIGLPHSTPNLLLVPASDASDQDDKPSSSSSTGTPNSQKSHRLHLSIRRCEGLGNKMFGSTISVTAQHDCDSPVGRRATSVIISSSTARLFPLSPTGSCPSPSISHPRPQSPRSSTSERNVHPVHSQGHSQNSSPPCMTSTSSSLFKCERIDQFKGDDHTEMTDTADCGETCQAHQPKLAKRILSSATVQAPQSIQANKMAKLGKEAEHINDFNVDTIDEVAEETLYQEIARLERVKEKWLKLCLEVEDVLKKSRERWPDHDKSVMVLKEFVNPSTRSSIYTFLERSRRLYKETSGDLFLTERVSQQDSTNQVRDDFTPPPKHPFGGRQSILSASAGNSRPRIRARDSVNTRASSSTPSKLRGTPSKSLTQSSFPLLITLPVPSAFVSPERFRTGPKAPKSEQGPRIKKISHTSWRAVPRQPTLSNRLGSPSVKLVTSRHYRARMMSGTSSTNVSLTSSNGKSILGERSINQLPTIMHQESTETDGDQKPASFPPKGVSSHAGTSSNSAGSLGRATANRPLSNKWELENEGSLFMSATVRETRKPWRRSILNQEILPRETRVSLAGSATGSVGSSTEEVGVLVAAGEQPQEFCSTFHASGSLRLKHRRRLHQVK
ncbi:hypothetical protein PCASD_15969 [Puccinia coronata f. sp. avenae]|uniref:Uncharacterized protein n=1 Tax=Puccinia coronata f. sp. avenae TaxID=200324 RepID=A0A2N5TVN6_9BASI|nr:hypothetical protein PCASD_15969 [Puccinia coronata f. sp. avenae]